MPEGHEFNSRGHRPRKIVGVISDPVRVEHGQRSNKGLSIHEDGSTPSGSVEKLELTGGVAPGYYICPLQGQIQSHPVPLSYLLVADELGRFA